MKIFGKCRKKNKRTTSKLTSTIEGTFCVEIDTDGQKTKYTLVNRN